MDRAEEGVFGLAATVSAVAGGGADGDGGADNKGEQAAVSGEALGPSAEGNSPWIVEPGGCLVLKRFAAARDGNSNKPEGVGDLNVALSAVLTSKEDNGDGAAETEVETGGPAVEVDMFSSDTDVVCAKGVCACIALFQA